MRLGYITGILMVIWAVLACKSSAAEQKNPYDTKNAKHQASFEKDIDHCSNANVRDPDLIKQESTCTYHDLSLMRALPKSMQQQIKGKWELVSYHFKDGEEYMEVPITPSPLDLVEQWIFTGSSYRLLMDKQLSFSGSYTLLESHKRILTFKGTHFILHAKKVRSSIPGVQRPEEFFYGILSEDSLILFYLGVTLKKEVSLSQGHRYEKKQR